MKHVSLTHVRTFARTEFRYEMVISRDTPVVGEPPAKNTADPTRSTRDANAPPCMRLLPSFPRIWCEFIVNF